MKVKALCNIIYGGKFYRAGDVFKANKLLPNTVSANEPDIKEEENNLFGEEEPIAESKPRKRR